METTPEMDLIQYLHTLPSFVSVGGFVFQFQFFINHNGYDGRLVYTSFMDEPGPDWVHSLGLQTSGWLWLIENISTETDMREAITNTRAFLVAQGIELVNPKEWADWNE